MKTDGQPITTMRSEIDPEIFNEVLFIIQDLFDRCTVDFIVLKDLAHYMVSNRNGWDQKPNLQEITLGVKKTQVNRPEWGIFQTMLKDLYNIQAQFDPTLVRFEYKGVPVYIKIIQRKYKFFENPDSVFYRIETFKIPNPFDEYWPARGLIR